LNPAQLEYGVLGLILYHIKKQINPPGKALLEMGRKKFQLRQENPTHPWEL
jgi:hypothetical protein